MNLNQLKVFHMVASLKSFTRAAAELFLTQPGISKHVKQLEEQFGIRLFDRIGKRVDLTQAGAVLFESTRIIFGLIDEAEEKINDLKEMSGGSILIGASFTAGTYLVPQIAGRFNRLYPDVAINMKTSLSDVVAENILANKLDIGFIGAPFDDERLVTEKLCDDDLVVIVSNDHQWKNRKTISLEHLVDHPFVLAARGAGTRAVIERRLKKAGLSLKKIIEFGNTEAVKKAVIAGIGVSILSKSAIANELAANQLVSLKLSGQRLKRTFYYTYRKDKYLTKAIRALIDLL